MRTKSLLILIAVVVAFGAYIVLFERHLPTTEEVNQQEDKVFAGLERDAISSIEITAPKASVSLRKEGDEWRLTAPIDYPADTAKVGSTLSSLLNLKAERTLAAGEVEPSAYGLDEPELTVVLGADDGAEHRLAIGTKSALGSNRAVSRDGAEILLCPGWFTNDLDRELEEWRSHEVVDVAANAVASIDLVAGDDHVEAVHTGDQWRLLSPVDDLADRDHLRNLVSDLDALRVKEFLDPGADLGALGLDPPAYTVTVVRQGGDQPLVLELGATRTRENATEVACRRNRSDLFWVTDRAQTRLAKAPVRWRSAKLYPFDTWEAERLALSRGETTVTVERQDGLWKTPSGAEADATVIQKRLGDLAALEAVDFDLLEPSTEKLGSVELGLKEATEGGGTTTVTFSFYAPIARGGNDAVTVSSRHGVMSVDPAAVEALLEHPESLLPAPTPTGAEPGEAGEAG